MAKQKSKKHHAESLWPSSLAPASRFDFAEFLREQAIDLRKLIRNAFEVAVESRIVETVITYNFVIVLPQTEYRYQLFSIRTLGGEFPARVVAPHMPEPFQVIPVNDEIELKQKLKSVFHHESTMNILKALAEEERGDLRSA